MTTWLPSPPARKGLLVAEIAVLLLATVVDSVLVLRAPGAEGLLAIAFTSLVPAVGPAAAVLAVLRRRFPRHVGQLGAAVVALSLVSTGSSVLISVTGAGSRAWPGATEVLALALLVGTGCRRLSWRAAAGLAVAGGAAMVAAPVVRYGIGSPAASLTHFIMPSRGTTGPLTALTARRGRPSHQRVVALRRTTQVGNGKPL
ncbi:hypothetical protein [Amycolatopsis sp.]|jgi:hypothetical protein|uniref:hypothetical protein n=1 Tax=Amycolatopsis sp. TaxID=37632 RepID=UPI002E0C9170|nr:hypothetical protein [Amycolatopsis sp.]